MPSPSHATATNSSYEHTMHPVLDDSTFESMRTLMKGRFPSIIEKYLQTSASYLEEIQAGVLRNNPQMVADNAHPLKSSSAALGFLQVADLAARLETRAKRIVYDGPVAPDSTSLAALVPAVNELRKALQETYDAIAQYQFTT